MTLIGSVFTVIYGLYIALGSSVSTHPWYANGLLAQLLSRDHEKIKIWNSGFLPNTIFRLSFSFCFFFFLADPISVKLWKRAVTRTNITMSGGNRFYRTFHAPSLLRIPHALHRPLQCCRRAGERRNVHCP